MSLTESANERAWREFESETCAICSSKKRQRNAFCPRCYFSLPKRLKDGLWKRFGQGFEEAYDEARDWLKQERLAKGNK